MVVPEGIDVSLTVSTGVKQTVIPDVTNKHYQEATIELQNAGFLVEIAGTEASDTVTKDYVISTDPAPGDELAAGSTVFLTVSAGPTIRTVTMPNLVGSTEKDAIARIESSNLSYGDTTYIHSDYDEGTVIRRALRHTATLRSIRGSSSGSRSGRRPRRRRSLRQAQQLLRWRATTRAISSLTDAGSHNQGPEWVLLR